MTCLAGRRWPGEEVFLQLRLNLVQNLGLADPDPVLGKGSLERARQVENLGSEGVSGSLEVALQEWRSRRMAERPPGRMRIRLIYDFPTKTITHRHPDLREQRGEAHGAR